MLKLLKQMSLLIVFATVALSGAKAYALCSPASNTTYDPYCTTSYLYVNTLGYASSNYQWDTTPAAGKWFAYANKGTQADYYSLVCQNHNSGPTSYTSCVWNHWSKWFGTLLEQGTYHCTLVGYCTQDTGALP